MAFNIIPRPKKLAPGRGGFTVDTTAAITFTGRDTIAAAYLAEAIWSRTDLEIEVASKKGSGYSLSLARRADPASLAAAARRALGAAGAGREAYGLVVTLRGLAAAANAPEGLFYAAATAAQLLEKREGRAFFPACTVSDWPDLEFRAVHVDLKHHMERFEYLVDLVRNLAGFKVNALVLELEDKFLYRKRPEVSAPLSLSADDLKSLTAVCKEFHVELVPLIQGLGHASYILKHPKYARLREKKDSFAEFCPQNEGTYRVLFDLYEEVAAATEGTRYFHIGGDEAWLMGNCPKCAKAVKKSGKFPLYQRWLTRCAGKIRSLGRVPMVWDDMLIKDAGDNWGKLPRDLFYVRWNYRPDAADRDRDKIANYANTGLKVIVAAAIQTDGPYVPIYHEHLANIDGYARAASAAGLTGILTTAWEDSGNHTETFWPGYAATGQGGWNSAAGVDFEFLVDFTRVFHAATDGRLASVYRTLGRTAMDCFRLLTPEEPYKAENMIPLPALTPQEPGRRWRDINSSRVAAAAEMAATLREAKKVLSAAILSGVAENVYALEVLLCATRVMLARVGLFFALRDAEIAIEDAHAAFGAGAARASTLLHDASVGVYGALAAGESALSSLEAVWLKTRLPQDMSLFDAPARKYLHDYDNYRHLAAKTTDLSYLLFVERRIGASDFAAKLMKASRDVALAASWPLE